MPLKMIIILITIMIRISTITVHIAYSHDQLLFMFHVLFHVILHSWGCNIPNIELSGLIEIQRGRMALTSIVARPVLLGDFLARATPRGCSYPASP